MVKSVLSDILLTPDKTQLHSELLEEIGQYITQEILNHPLMKEESQRVSILLDGSTALGVVDEQSDVDIIIICQDEYYSSINHRFEQAGLIPEQSSFFMDLRLPSGKSGHYTLHKISEIKAALMSGNMEWLWNASISYIYYDRLDVKSLFDAYVPLQPEVLMRFRKNSYIQLRSYAKSLDNPVVRGDAFPILFLAVSLYKEALRCAITIEGYPYPYDKWLVPVAKQTTVGRKITECAGDFWSFIRDDESFAPMYQEDNNFVKMEKRFRKILVEEFRMRGINEPWLVEWWKFMEE
ncbi:nucleotidyltransferase domain-containing protein [Paenibacillus odorifer]|uniref:nucleotidyltransferase domain-containing protein n=1 Tax=Paenibacillus odorifer TaxID=189426 RepID=UPI002DBFF6D2|nr:nucleotidyltransferase domain-containing protein [Paenibacillus odorifer]MEC0131920.1 nucleotidyltransferase domain-containing protein [Paenibacillus odorifer]MEC0221604.1 nucleotidyltransferase domain-containing protein [Paenibacillus odorifer]